LLVLNKVTR